MNGTTIPSVPLSEMGNSCTVYHIETEDNETILANGAPAESIIDNLSRRVCDNNAEFEALYDEVPEMEDLDHPARVSGQRPGSAQGLPCTCAPFCRTLDLAQCATPRARQK